MKQKNTKSLYIYIYIYREREREKEIEREREKEREKFMRTYNRNMLQIILIHEVNVISDITGRIYPRNASKIFSLYWLYGERWEKIIK